MSRLVKADFNDVTAYLKSYSIAQIAEKPQFMSVASKCHKRYFGVMVFTAELFDKQPGSSSAAASQQAKAIFDRNVYLQEFVSDLGGALFNWCHGAYKASRLLLRSSLENLIKALTIPENPGVLALKSVYEVFDTASKTKVFAGKVEKGVFSKIRQNYALLCADAHGATVANLQQTKSLNYFPTFDATMADSVADIYVRVSGEALNILCLACKPVVIGMHYANNDAIAPLLSKGIKRELHALD